MSASCRRRWTPAKSTDVTSKAARLARLHAATDRQLGARVRVEPQTNGGYVAGGVDPARPPVAISAYVTRTPTATHAATNDGQQAPLRITTETVKYTTSALPYAVAEGDLVRLLDEPGQPLFRVSRTAPFGTDRTILFLVRTAR